MTSTLHPLSLQETNWPFCMNFLGFFCLTEEGRLYIIQFQLLTSPPCRKPGNFLGGQKSQHWAKNGFKATVPGAKHHVRKDPKAPPQGQNKNLNFSRNWVSLHKYQIFDDILIWNSLVALVSSQYY